MITRKTNSSRPIAAIAGVVPHPGTTLPCPELPIDLRRLPIGVFCPMAKICGPYECKFRYSMGNPLKGRIYLSYLMQSSSPALSLMLGLVVALFGLTGFGIYTSFGPPSKKLDDPFDEHDD